MLKDQYSLGGILIELEYLYNQLESAPTQDIDSQQLLRVRTHVCIAADRLRTLLEDKEING